MLTRRALLALGVGLVGGCAAPARALPDGAVPTVRLPPGDAPTGDLSSGTAASDADGARVVDRLRATLSAGDRAGFVATASAPMRTRAAVLFDNWRALSSVQLDHDPTPDGGPGDLVVRWRAGDEVRPGENRLGLVVSRTGASREGELVDLSDEGRHAASWAHDPVVVARRGPVAVVSAVPDRAHALLDAASWAATRLVEAGLDGFGWDGSLVVEVPADLLGFGRMARSSGPVAGLAAVSLSSTPDAGYRVIVNPSSTLAPDDLRGVLLHEGVHVVTRAMWRTAPLWVAEGLAESVATAHWPAQADRNAALVRRAAASGGLTLPTGHQLRAEGDEGDTAYAVAQAAVEAMAGRWGETRVHAWVADWTAGDRPDEAALTAALRQATGG